MKPLPEINHEIHELLKKRWSPRSFSEQVIDKETIMSLFEAARWAASAMNEQPWCFIYATKNDTQKFKKIINCLVEGNQVWAKNAPLLMITFIKKTYKKTNSTNNWAMHDLGLAMGNFTTQASSMGIYVHHMAGFIKAKVIKEFNIPTDIEPVTIVAAGYLGNHETLPKELKEKEIAPQVRKEFNDLFLNDQ